MIRYSRPLRLLLPSLLILAMVAMCGAQSQADKDKNKKTQAKAKEPASTNAVYIELMSFFDQKDASRDGSWSKEEIISAYGLPNVNQALGLYDMDKDGRVSRAEYEDWVKAHAAEIAEEREEAQREYEEAVKQYQEALAKAAKDARERIQRAQQQARQRFDNARRNRNDRRNDLNRRDRRRRR